MIKSVVLWRVRGPQGVVASLLMVFACVGIMVPDANAFTNTTGTVNINEFIGADAFYDAGYTGTRTNIGNIESGHVWSGHETLDHMIDINIPPLGDLDYHKIDAPLLTGQVDKHATWVGFIMAGRPTDPNDPDEMQRGIAYGSELWTGAIGNSWNQDGTKYVTSFNVAAMDQVDYPYQIMTETGVLEETVDVINGSWGEGASDANGAFTRLIDAVVSRTGTTVVFAAGNKGSAANTVIGPAIGPNSIAVGATHDGQDPGPYYDSIPGWSSRGPSDFYVPLQRAGTSGTTIDAVVSPIDLVAPARRLKLGSYDGLTGGAQWQTHTPTGNPADYDNDRVGTSFSSPIVAGGAALLIDVGKDLYGADAIHPSVVKSVLLNSADKLTGWNNGQSLNAGVITTIQSLDYAQGAGQIDLGMAFDQYTAGTTDVPSLLGGSIDAIGWDFGNVADGAPNSYHFMDELQAGTDLTATLSWLADRDFDYTLHESFYDSFDDLDLEIWQTDGEGGLVSLIAESVSTYNSVEHLHFLIPQTGYYAMRVKWESEIYDFVADIDAEDYGLAWATTFVSDSGDPIPAPATFALGMVGLGSLCGRRRSRR